MAESCRGGWAVEVGSDELRQSVTFSLDLRRGTGPEAAIGGAETFCDVPRPSEGFDSRCGLHWPLPAGKGLAFWNNGKMSDLRGALVVTFSVEGEDAGGLLVRGWGGYFRLSFERAEPSCEAHLSAYGHHLRLAGPWQGVHEFTIRASWDAHVGMMLSLSDEKQTLGSVARNITWHAYQTRCVPIEIGGEVRDTRPEARIWDNAFTGCIRQVACYSLPVEPPGLPRTEAGPSAGQPSSDLWTGLQAADAPGLRASRATPRGQDAPGALPRVAEGLTLLELYDPPIVDSPLRFDVVPNRLENYAACRREHPEIVESCRGAKSAFEGLLTAARWVAGLWPHTNYWPWPRRIFEDRGDVLLRDIKAGNVVGMCGGFAHVMEEVCWALGVPARRTQVYGHSSFEAYDHTHDKWICLEADNHCHAGHWAGPDGVPYSIGEQIAILDRDAVEPGACSRLVRHVPLGCQAPVGQANVVNPEQWFRSCYIYMGYNRRNDYGDPEPAPSYWYMPPWYRPWTPDPAGSPGAKALVEDWRTMYWSCDRVRVTAEWAASSDRIELSLTPFQAQLLDGYRVVVDGRPAVHQEPRFCWRLHPGVNRLEIAVRTQLGATGHPWRAVVHRRP